MSKHTWALLCPSLHPLPHSHCTRTPSHLRGKQTQISGQCLHLLTAEASGLVGVGCLLTSLAPPLLGAVDVVLQLDADLPLVGEVSDEGVLEELLGARPLAVTLHQAALYERLELLRPDHEHTHEFIAGNSLLKQQLH